MREVKFDIEAREFGEMRNQVNYAMQGVLLAILAGKTSEGTVTLSINIESVPTQAGLTPKTTYKCAASYKRNEKVNGNIHHCGTMILGTNEVGDAVGMTDEPEQVTMEDVLGEET